MSSTTRGIWVQNPLGTPWKAYHEEIGASCTGQTDTLLFELDISGCRAVSILIDNIDSAEDLDYTINYTLDKSDATIWQEAIAADALGETAQVSLWLTEGTGVQATNAPYAPVLPAQAIQGLFSASANTTDFSVWVVGI